MTSPRKIAPKAMILLLTLLGATKAYSQIDADAAHIANKGALVSSTSICHRQNLTKPTNMGVFEDPRVNEHSCGDHSGFIVHEDCGGGGANPPASAAALCKGSPYYTARPNFPAVDGNNCGYSWFTINCWAGR